MKNLFILFVLCASFYSCTKDTCNSKLGDTFLDLDTPTIDQDSLGGFILIANMNTLDDLTEDYFNATVIIKNEKDRFGNEWQNDHDLVLETIFTKEKFTIRFNEFDILNHGQLELHFRLRDRKDFIDCDHGGSGDTYFLNIQFTVIENDEQNLIVTNFNWEEEFKAGPF